MDIVGPLLVEVAQKKFLLVAIDYFIKWIEAETYASIKDKDVSKFVRKNIVFQFGIPQAIIADNWPQFDSIAFRTFYLELKIKNLYSTHDTFKAMDKRRQRIKPCSPCWRKNWKKPKESGSMNCPNTYGLTEQHLDDWREPLPSLSHTRWRQSFQLK